MIKNKNIECWIIIVIYILAYFILLSLWNSIDANMKYWALMEKIFHINTPLQWDQKIQLFLSIDAVMGKSEKWFWERILKFWNMEVVQKKWLCNRNGNYSLFLSHCISTCGAHQIVWYIILTKWRHNKYAEWEIM